MLSYRLARLSLQMPSMKVPPKRKGNPAFPHPCSGDGCALNESPSEKEGKSAFSSLINFQIGALNESPSEKEGKSCQRPLEVVSR